MLTPLSDNRRILTSAELLAMSVLMVMTLWLRLRALPTYPITGDELITLSALKGIVASGVPRFGEEGAIYWRALLPHYLMAMPLFFTEATVQAARLVPTLLSVLVLPVAYAGGRLLAGRTAAWLTAGFLAFSNYQNYHAAFARFYLPFQLFFLAATLLAGSYFILKRRTHGPWLLVATLATLASHALAVCLLPLLGLAFLCGKRWDLLRSWSFASAVLLVAGFAWLNIFWRPENVFVNPMVVSLVMGGLANKWAFYEHFRQYVPFGWSLILLGVLPVLWSGSRLWLYLWGGFLIEMIFLSLAAPDPNVRYLSHLFAYGVLLAMASLGWCASRLWQGLRMNSRVWSRQGLLVGGVVLLAATSHLVFAENLDLRKGFGNSLISYDQGPAHAYMARLVRPEDVVISMDPPVTAYLLERPVDHWLREKFDPATRSFAPYAATLKEANPAYYIDSPERLQEVLAATRQRIWIYLNNKILITTSKPLRDLMEKNFVTVFGDEQMQTYVLVRY